MDKHQALIDQGVIRRGDDGRIYLTRAAWQNATCGTPYAERGIAGVTFTNAEPLTELMREKKDV